VGFSVLVTLLGVLASLASGGMMCWPCIIATGGDDDDCATVMGLISVTFDIWDRRSLILLFHSLWSIDPLGLLKLFLFSLFPSALISFVPMRVSPSCSSSNR